MKVKLRKASSVQPKAIEWLWPRRVAKGKVTVFCGDPGVGKGLVSCDFVAALTTGRRFPDAENTVPPSSVIMLFCEDGEADTVRPRLEAASADLDRVLFLDSTVFPSSKDEKKPRMLSLERDLDLLRKELSTRPQVGLVVIDPVTSYLDGADMNKEQEIRRVLGPLAQLAEETGVSILLLMHFNKRVDVNALHRVMGAIAMTGVARATFLLAPDKDDDEIFLFLPGKMNIARKPKGLKYAICEKELSVGVIPFIEWRGTTEVTADQALTPGGDSDKLKEAIKWLAGFLTQDTPAKEVHEAAKEAGITERTLMRAKKKWVLSPTRHRLAGCGWPHSLSRGMSHEQRHQGCQDGQRACYGSLAVLLTFARYIL